MLFQPIPLSPYHFIPISFFFIFSKNLKQCFVENNAQLQKLYLSLSQKQVLFFIYTEIFYGSALLTLKTYALYPLGKNTEDLKLDWCLDQRKITSYIMSRTIYLQLLYFFINWNISHAIIICISIHSSHHTTREVEFLILLIHSSPRWLWWKARSTEDSRRSASLERSDEFLRSCEK